MTTQRRTRALVALAAAVALSATSCAAGGSSTGGGGKQITIGLLATLTGATASDGLAAQRGAQLAIKQLNAKGGAAGYTFALKSEDTKSQSNDAVTTGVQDLTSDSSVKAVVSGYASTTNFEINNFARDGMIYVIGGGAAQTEAIIKPNPERFPTIWSVVPSYEAYGRGPVELLDRWTSGGEFRPRTKTAYVITSDNPYSKGISQGLTSSLTRSGWQIAGNQTVPFGTVNDWGTVLADVRAKNPDFIVNTDYQVSNEITFLRQFLQNPTDSLMFMQYGPSQPEFVQTAGAAANGILYNGLGSLIESPKYSQATALSTAYRQEYGASTVDPQAVLTYEAIMVYAGALAKVGDPDKKTEIGKAIGASTTTTASGTLAFDPATHLAKQGDELLPLQSFQIQDGKRALLAPAEYATGTFRLPPWMTR